MKLHELILLYAHVLANTTISENASEPILVSGVTWLSPRPLPKTEWREPESESERGYADTFDWVAESRLVSQNF